MSVEPEDSFRAPASDPPAYIRQKSYMSEKIGQSSTQLKVSIRCLMSVWFWGVTLWYCSVSFRYLMLRNECVTWRESQRNRCHGIAVTLLGWRDEGYICDVSACQDRIPLPKHSSEWACEASSDGVPKEMHLSAAIVMLHFLYCLPRSGVHQHLSENNKKLWAESGATIHLRKKEWGSCRTCKTHVYSFCDRLRDTMWPTIVEIRGRW